MTAEITMTAERRRTSLVRLALVAVAIAGSVAGCGRDAPIYQIGQGAPDTSGYELAHSESGGAEAIGTPVMAVERWGFGCRQLFAGGRSGTAVLLQQPCGENQQVFAVTGDFWGLYASAGDGAILKYGFPVGRRGEWKQGWTQGFGRGGVFTTFFMQRPGGQPHVLSGSMLEHYLSFDDRDVRFGYPTGEMVQRGNELCQEFEHAVITATGKGNRLAFNVVTGADLHGIARCS